MIRRRRRTREIPFSFDSFLDIVANVVGIIIRLILVVWVGARSYSSIQPVFAKAAPAKAAQATTSAPDDPLQAELESHRRELAKAQAELLEQLRKLGVLQEDRNRIENEDALLLARLSELESGKSKVEKTSKALDQESAGMVYSSKEIRQRMAKLALEMAALRKLPSPKKALHYRVPISRPLQSEELFFECRGGRVTFVDIGALLGQVRERMEDNVKLLRTQWSISEIAGPVGAFQLSYTLERERGMLDGGGMAPEASGTFRYGMSGWKVEPIALDRGETSAQALAANGVFRQIVDHLDPQQTAVTFWVYPDSFPLFRQLRDYLYERDVTVAGRPLPEGTPIASSREGTASRGQ
jgi:hypothetical protein